MVWSGKRPTPCRRFVLRKQKLISHPESSREGKTLNHRKAVADVD